jgi:4-hydroxybenzoyl-CoA thioesterase
MAFRFTLPVRFDDVDHAGIVYYPRFFHYFHQAFEEIFRQRYGGPAAYVSLLDDDRVGLPAVHCEATFKRPLRYGDDVDIEVTLDRLGDRSVTLAYKALKGRELCAEAKVTCALTNLDTFQSMPVPDALRALFESL